MTNRNLIAGIIGAALLSIISQGWSQGQIAASPKVRQALNERKLIDVTAGKGVSMVCPKCGDIWAIRHDSDAKGSKGLLSKEARTRTVATHLCKGCSNTWQVKEEGKGKSAVAKHGLHKLWRHVQSLL